VAELVGRPSFASGGRSAEDLPYIMEGAKNGVGKAHGYSVQRSSASNSGTQ
jgi:hypothetical protein